MTAVFSISCSGGGEASLLTHPKIGASWEGYAIEEAIRRLEPDQAYFWATHNGAELDLLLFKEGRRVGKERDTSRRRSGDVSQRSPNQKPPES